MVPIDSNYHRRLPYGTLSICPLPLTPNSGGWLLCVSKTSPQRTTSGELSGSCSLRSGRLGVDSVARYRMGPGYTPLSRQVRVPVSEVGKHSAGPSLLLTLSKLQMMLSLERLLGGLSRSEHSADTFSGEDTVQVWSQGGAVDVGQCSAPAGYLFWCFGHCLCRNVCMVGKDHESISGHLFPSPSFWSTDNHLLPH